MSKAFMYKNHPLARIVTIYGIVSADYLQGAYPAIYPHKHPDAWELCYCMQGTITYYKNGQPVTLHSGEIAFASPDTSHDSQSDNPDTTAFLISFTCSHDYIKALKNTVIPVTPRQAQLFCQVISELELAFEPEDRKQRRFHFSPSQNSPVGSEQLICTYLEQILIDILREITNQDGRPIQNKNFPKAMNSFLAANVSAYIRSHIREPLTVEKIAEEFHYSRTWLSTVYKAATGIGINEFLSSQRMDQAKSLLLEGQLTVAQISELLGFSSPQYFSRKFTQTVGCPPSQYVDTLHGTFESPKKP
ncbi:MAG: AraC family transcriptional regulator [Lachnospiraceae bacterium]|nr:AraC family transcriptional regulator [Lachnospiraceae bacterium]